MKNLRVIYKIFLATSGVFSLGIILFSSALNIYSNREKIKGRIKGPKEVHHANRFLVNPLKQSDRQLPKPNLKDLNINPNANLIGQWSAPIDWNVTAIHSILLPDYSVMTFGSFGIERKEKGDLRKNKEIKLTDGRTLKRDNGLYQWIDHDVNSGVDFDIWDFKKGYGENSHTLFKKPILMDSFCSVARVIDNENIFILGGNKNINTNLPDTQAGTMIYNIKEKKFISSKSLNFKRWYPSLVRTSDNKLVLIGGTDHVNANPAIIPEILDLNKIEDGWRPLYKAKSKKLFGEPDPDKENNEWYYPRSYLASDGNIVGISYNKVWMMDKNDDFRVYQTNEIELETGGIKGIIEDIEMNDGHDLLINHDHKGDKVNSHKKKKNNPKKIRLLTVGSPVGIENSTVMLGKDIVYIFGGKQTGDEYSPSNKVLKIDFSDSRKPKIFKANSMLMPRYNANATILPNGKIFINGGSFVLSAFWYHKFSNIFSTMDSNFYGF